MLRNVPGACCFTLAFSVVLCPPGAVHFSCDPAVPSYSQPSDRKSLRRSLVRICFTV